MSGAEIGVLGASSLVGQVLLPALRDAGFQVTAYSRQQCAASRAPGVRWVALPEVARAAPHGAENCPAWISLMPLWALPDYFPLMQAQGVRRVVALSSTSRLAKEDSPEPRERLLAKRLAHAESQLQVWAGQLGIEYVILRPTLVYGLGRDRNVSLIARQIRRWGVFPLLGEAKGLRQPIHVADVAAACLRAMQAGQAVTGAYNISGGETLPYHEMVARIFAALGLPVRVLRLPLPLFRLLVACFRLLPPYRDWSVAMVERMNRDLVFDHADAARDLAFQPRPFSPSRQDVSA